MAKMPAEVVVPPRMARRMLALIAVAEGRLIRFAPAMRRRLVGILAVALAVGVLAACARAVDGTPLGPRVWDYDISRLDTLQAEFPPGYDRVQTMPVITLGAAADKFSDVGVGEVVAVEPPDCGSLLQPVRPPRDAQFTMAGAIGEGPITVAAVKSRERLVEAGPVAGCDHATVTRKISGHQYDSTVIRLPGPTIDGVTTTGSVDVAVAGGVKTYVFAAFLSDTVAVAVRGLLPGDRQAEQTLQDLLVKAVNAIRTQ
jgi:hypothetical protein